MSEMDNKGSIELIQQILDEKNSATNPLAEDDTGDDKL